MFKMVSNICNKPKHSGVATDMIYRGHRLFVTDYKHSLEPTDVLMFVGKENGIYMFVCISGETNIGQCVRDVHRAVDLHYTPWYGKISLTLEEKYNEDA